MDTFFLKYLDQAVLKCCNFRIGDLHVLIDAGLTCKRIQNLLRKEGLGIEKLDAVFLTHEHNDHSIGVKGLSKFANIPIYANEDTIQVVQPKLS